LTVRRQENGRHQQQHWRCPPAAKHRHTKIALASLVKIVNNDIILLSLLLTVWQCITLILPYDNALENNREILILKYVTEISEITTRDRGTTGRDVARTDDAGRTSYDRDHAVRDYDWRAAAAARRDGPTLRRRVAPSRPPPTSSLR